MNTNLSSIISAKFVKGVRVAFLLQLFSFSGFSIAADNSAAVISDMNTFVTQRSFQEAYALGQANFFELEGEPEFDFLFGLSALEVGRPDEAVFAFERVAYNYTDQQRVKLELARAYYMSNNFAAANTLFREVLDTNPEPNVVANIEGFLELIEQRQSAVESSFDYYVTSSWGDDSNINSATELGIINTPIGDISLSSGGQSIRNNYLDIGGGLTFTHPLDKNRAFTLSGTANRHNNMSSDQFDLDVFSANAAYITARNDLSFNTALRVQKVDLDRSAFQNSTSLMSTVQRAGNNGWSQSVTGAYTAVRYDTDTNINNNLRDINQILVSGTLGKTSNKNIHNVTAYYGDDSVLRDQGKNNETSFYGLAFSEQYLFRPGHVPYFRVSMHKSKHQGNDPIFVTKRTNKTFSSSLGWLWQASRNLNVTTDVTFTDNDSNISLYAYDRLKWQTSLRYQF